jgi:hypothetical protein
MNDITRLETGSTHSSSLLIILLEARIAYIKDTKNEELLQSKQGKNLFLEPV